MWKNLKFMDWMVVILGFIFAVVTLITAIVTGIRVANAQGESTGIVVGVNLALVGVLFGGLALIFGILRDGLKGMDDRINLHCRHDESTGRLLSQIIRLLPNAAESKRLEVRKRFNGIYYNLKQEGLQRDLAATILYRIEENPNLSAVTSFPLEWWFQPEGVFYLVKQLMVITKKTGQVHRFAIYDRSVYKEYGTDFMDLFEVHKRAGGKFTALLQGELNHERDTILETMKKTGLDVNPLRDFIKAYLKRSHGLWPDVILIDSISYLRDEVSGELLPHSDVNILKQYIKFLETATKNESIHYKEEELVKDIIR